MRYTVAIIFLSFGLMHCIDHQLNSLPEKDCKLTAEHEGPNDLGNRLPNDVLPKKYVIAISLDLYLNVFHGAIQITCEIIKPRNYVVLHAKDLDIESTQLYQGPYNESCHPLSLESVFLVERLEMVVLKSSKILQPGNYTIRMNFSGSMDNRINGLYISTYKSSYGDCSRRKLAVTQFEPTYARKAFPCFDEPSLKAIFDIRIIYASNPGYHVMSNMPCLTSEKSGKKGDLAIWSFATSLPMSTYLVAFIVSDYSCITSVIDSLTGTSIPISVCSSLDNKKKIRYALSVAMKALNFYIHFFQIDYPLPKIDLVGVPDFAAGAMENWGLITFRETEILHSHIHSSVGNIKSVALTIAHELAHMWFGNLVTLNWWDDLWLNEGFATYMEHVAVNSIFPEWQQMDSFALETKYLTMRSDSKITTHPIIRRTKNTDEIGQMFDHISYQKGAAVIKMLEDAMGSSNFLSGIREYLRKYKFKNAASCQLLEILQKHFKSKVDLIGFISSWTESPGFPVVNVRRTKTGLQLFQKRFLSKGMLDDNSTWDLPIRYVTSRKEDEIGLVWFLANTTCAEFTIDKSVDWIKMNHRSIGYYIVNYDEEEWNVFIKLLSSNKEVLNALDRADLLHDSFFLADSDDLDYTISLNLTRYLLNETALQPWVVAVSWILRVDRLLAGTQFHRRFRYYARHLIGGVYRKISWEPAETECFDNRELRMLILRVACSLGHRDCLRVGEEKLRIFLKSNGTIRPHPDVRSITYSFEYTIFRIYVFVEGVSVCSGFCNTGLVRLGPEHCTLYEVMWRLFLQESDPQEKERLLIGLADIREPAIIIRYLERVANESLVRRQNYFEAVGKVASNPTGLEIVWNFLRNNWEALVEKYTLNDASMGALVGKIVSSFKNVHRLKEAKEFFEKYPKAGAGENSRRLALEECASNIEWLEKYPRIIDRWLKTNNFQRDSKKVAPK